MFVDIVDVYDCWIDENMCQLLQGDCLGGIGEVQYFQQIKLKYQERCFFCKGWILLEEGQFFQIGLIVYILDEFVMQVVLCNWIIFDQILVWILVGVGMFVVVQVIFLVELQWNVYCCVVYLVFDKCVEVFVMEQGIVCVVMQYDCEGQLVFGDQDDGEEQCGWIGL